MNIFLYSYYIMQRKFHSEQYNKMLENEVKDGHYWLDPEERRVKMHHLSEYIRYDKLIRNIKEGKGDAK